VALLVGLAGCGIIWVVAPYLFYVLRLPNLTASYLPDAVLALILLLVVVVNPLLLWRRRRALSPGQLALAAGMCVAPHLSVEFDFDWLDDFEADDLILVGDDLVRVRSDVGIATYLVTAKVSPMAEPGTFDFYGLAGMGWMDGDADFVVTGVRTLGLGDTGGDFAAKVGAGAEYWPGLPVGFGLELAYVFGFGDMDEIQYTQLTGKAIYRF